MTSRRGDDESADVIEEVTSSDHVISEEKFGNPRKKSRKVKIDSQFERKSSQKLEKSKMESETGSNIEMETQENDVARQETDKEDQVTVKPPESLLPDAESRSDQVPKMSQVSNQNSDEIQKDKVASLPVLDSCQETNTESMTSPDPLPQHNSVAVPVDDVMAREDGFEKQEKDSENCETAQSELKRDSLQSSGKEDLKERLAGEHLPGDDVTSNGERTCSDAQRRTRVTSQLEEESARTLLELANQTTPRVATSNSAPAVETDQVQPDTTTAANPKQAEKKGETGVSPPPLTAAHSIL